MCGAARLDPSGLGLPGLTWRQDTSSWEHYDLSCKARDDSEDGVLRDANGNPILGADGRPITIPPCYVGPDGVLYAAAAPTAAVA